MSQFVTLNPGDKVADHLSLGIDRAMLRRNGYKASAVYLKALIGTDGGVAGRRWIEQAAADRWPLFLIYEQKSTAGLSGYAAGQVDGAYARQQARQLGVGDDVEIINAGFDFDVTPATASVCAAYAQGFAKGAGLNGRYGDRDLIDVTYTLGGTNWQMASGWFSRVLGTVVTHPQAHLKQSPSIPFGLSRIDPNLVVRPVNVWLPTPAAPPPPLPAVPAPTLQQGSRGPQVVALQQALAFWKWGSSPADGQFGPVTAQGVRTMQTKLRIVVDGVYGPQTAHAYAMFFAAMNNLGGK